MSSNPEPSLKPISFTKTWHSTPYPFISPTRPALTAKNKNVIVTGGGTGIGNAIAIAFAQAGAKSVSILGRRREKLETGMRNIEDALAAEAGSHSQEEEQDGVRILYEVTDLTNLIQTQTALKSIVEKVGPIDIFISNAASMAPFAPITAQSPDPFLSSVDTYIRSSLNSIQSFLPLAASDPVFINTSSCLANISANLSPIPGSAAYAVGKAGVLKLMDYLIAENEGLHVVNVQPGWVPTEGNGYQEGAPDSVNLPGHFYVWLASSEARFLRGKFVWANWDAEEMVQRAEEIRGSKLLDWVVEGVPM